MAMKELFDRDCGGVNPLVNLTSYIAPKNKDAIFKSPAGLDNEFSAEFLAEQRSNMAPVTFGMDGLLQELHDIERSNQQLVAGPDVLNVAADAWASQFLEDSNFAPNWSENQLSSEDVWAGEFLNNKNSTVEAPKAPGNLWAHEYLDLLDEIENRNAEFEEIFSSEAQKTSPTVPENLSEAAQELLEGVDTSDPKLANSEFIKFVKQITVQADKGADKPEKADALAAGVGSWDTEFTSSLDRLERAQRVQEFSEAHPTGVRTNDWVPEFTDSLQEVEELTEWYNDVPHEAMAEKWAAEFTAEAQSEDFWSNLQKQWEILAEEDVEGVHDWLADYNKLNTSDSYKEYKFEDDNPHEEVSNPFDEGRKRLEDGDISNAVLLFEAAVQKNPQHAEAWQYLGIAQASNEHDRFAIAALRKCLELDERNLSALLSLAVSYTNESMQRQACDCLVSWLTYNPVYSHLFNGDAAEHSKSASSQSSKTPVISSFVSSDRYNEVKELLLRAVQTTPDQVDPDVQVGLGTVFSLRAEYDKAVDCFTAALQVRPEDSLIWNKLGASLANGRRSEEAVDAYRRALDLSPGYVRTRYNLGVACVNLGAYREAMEHFLTALSLQLNSISRSFAAPTGAQAGSSAGSSITQSTISESLWTSLRTSLVLLDRSDLLAACDERNFDVLNKEFNSS